MKNKEIVKILIDKLKKQATTDFELHRVEVLERDFFNPPKPEQVDETHQSFDGRKFTLKPDGHYVSHFPIHQAVYQYYFGEIPDDCDIHHIDENPANNDISNLECLTRVEHLKKHRVKRHKIELTCLHCKKKFWSSNKHAKFCSGRCQHDFNAEIKVCPVCGKEFKAWSKKQTYCSHRCYQNNYFKERREKLDGKTFICASCGKEYYSHNRESKFCSPYCRYRYQYDRARENRICEVCGKEFNCYKYSKQKVCSHHCAGKSSALKRASIK